MAIFRRARDLRRVPGIDQATCRLLLGFVVPVWLASGFADWYQHRRTAIEHTAGTRESALHLLMLTEAGIPSLLALFLEINAGVLLTAYAALLAHDVTALWDICYADGRRRVTPIEQHIHSFLEVGPVMAVTFLTVMYWDQARALVGVGEDRPDFRFQPKDRPLSPRYTAGLLAAIGALGVLPYAEEFLRCWRAEHSASRAVGHDHAVVSSS